ncbi:hypothetical protein [Sulfodiicoccus acidiphilus]|uniref:hypothetical protein n=1 Tax=Sulfodiicoccus acidiphilus TaxID=1670455 RepID=UPI000F82CECD|nr:hypothetical protein [Sulfodiicoccus acidiphilus]
MTVIDGVSVTETPWLKRGSVWYASAPPEGPSWAPAGLEQEDRSGSVRPSVPVEFRPLPVLRYWQGGAGKQEAPPFRAG